MVLDAYTVVFLRRPPDAPPFSEARLAALQAEHVAFSTRMRAEGHAVLTGPLRNQPDPSLCAINLYRTSPDETRRLAGGEPLVRAGRLAFEVVTWLLPEGLLGDRPAERLHFD